MIFQDNKIIVIFRDIYSIILFIGNVSGGMTFVLYGIKDNMHYLVKVNNYKVIFHSSNNQ